MDKNNSPILDKKTFMLSYGVSVLMFILHALLAFILGELSFGLTLIKDALFIGVVLYPLVYIGIYIGAKLKDRS